MKKNNMMKNINQTNSIIKIIFEEKKKKNLKYYKKIVKNFFNTILDILVHSYSYLFIFFNFIIFVYFY